MLRVFFIVILLLINMVYLLSCS